MEKFELKKDNLHVLKDTIRNWLCENCTYLGVCEYFECNVDRPVDFFIRDLKNKGK